MVNLSPAHSLRLTLNRLYSQTYPLAIHKSPSPSIPLTRVPPRILSLSTMQPDNRDLAPKSLTYLSPTYDKISPTYDKILISSKR